MTHPVVALVLSLPSDQAMHVRTVLDRGDTVAVVVESALVRQHIVVEKVDGQWELPEYIGGAGRHPAHERPAHAADPPMLSERQVTRSGRPQPDGSRPTASWCVVSGVAAVDARTVTVALDDDIQRCSVGDDGFVAALIYGRWGEAPRITVERPTDGSGQDDWCFTWRTANEPDRGDGSVISARLKVVPDVSVGEWIADRLGPFGGWVGSVVPQGFPAYARVLHPVGGDTEPLETWAEVCAVTGREPHTLMQWDSISVPHIQDGSRAVSDGTPWEGDPPRIGDLAPEALAALCRVLATHTASKDVYFGVWDGWGWLNGGGAFARSSSGGSLRDAAAEALWAPSPRAFDETVMAGPRLHLPHRDYVLFTGPLDAAIEIGHWPTVDWFIPQSPSLIWPPDHSWCVATEIDFTFTLVGGHSTLIDAIVADPRLDTWPVDATAHVGGGDPINT